jgi:pyruvate/2-oxoglutarate dehydrogenase complex dihydrolipoamide dehydrogenase (E3) component
MMAAMGKRSFDVFVVGGGGTGSEIVGRIASPAGLHVGMAERERMGGECNWYGCVPTKVMLRSAGIAAVARDAGRFGVNIPEVDVDFEAVRARMRRIIDENVADGARPFTDRGAEVRFESVRLTGPNELETAGGDRITAERIVLATGSEAVIPPIEGLAEGPHWTNKEAIWHEGGLPSSLAIIGGGPIGVEFAQIHARFGTKVTIIEATPRLLPPEDEASGLALAGALQADGVEIITGARINAAHHDAAGWHLDIGGRAPLDCEAVLVATGRRPVLAGHDLEAAGVVLDDRGHPLLGDTLRTSAGTIWVAGDATGDLLFTHVGTYEAGIVVDDLLGRPRPRDYRVVPKVTYTDPEVSSVGLTEAAARDAGHEVATAMFALRDNERARIDARPDGHVKLVADARSRELLGGHIVGEGAGQMIHEVVIAMAGRVPIEVVAGAIHAYPTVSEAVGAAFSRLAETLGA